MARPPLPLGSYGKVTVRPDGGGFVARTRFRDHDGVVRLVKRSGRSRAAAERALKAALLERQAPVTGPGVGPHSRVRDVAELWFEEITAAVDAGRRSPGTLDTYRAVYRRSVLPALGEMRVREVTTPVADRVLRAIAERSPSAARTSKVVMSGVFGYAARHGVVAVNPVREVGRIESAPRRRPRSLTAEERRTWLAALEADERARTWDLPDLTRVMLATGCRVGECLALGWSEVDIDGGFVDVRWRLVRRTGVGLLRLPSTKSGAKGERLLPLPAWAVEVLRRRRSQIGPDVEPVFPDSLGGWRDPNNVLRVWRAVREDADLDGLVSHTLRKTVASFLDDDGRVSVRQISDQLGHAKVSMTQDRYLGRRLTDRRTADVLEGMLDDVRPESGPKAVPADRGARGSNR